MAGTRPPAWKRAGFSTPNAYAKANRLSQQWSAKSSNVDKSAWDDKFTPEQKGSYYRAFVSSATGVAAYGERNREGGGSKYLHKFLVVDTGRITQAEWDEKYVGLQ